MSPEISARLEQLHIEVTSAANAYHVLLRGNCIAVIHLRDGRWSIGSSGMMTEGGLAYLLWKDGRAVLAAHGCQEIEAAQEQVEAIQRFSEDVKTALA